MAVQLPDTSCPISQVDAISADWAARADLPQHVVQMVANFPNTLHPMSQFSAALSAMQLESKFARAYAEGMHKTKYWEVSGGSSRRSVGAAVLTGRFGKLLYVYLTGGQQPASHCSLSLSTHLTMRWT